MPRKPRVIVLDQTPEAAQMRLESFEKDPSCKISLEQIEADRKIVEAAKPKVLD